MSAIKIVVCTVIAWALFALAASALLFAALGEVALFGLRSVPFGQLFGLVAGLVVALGVIRFAIVAPLLTVDRESDRWGSSWRWSIIVWPPRS